MVTSGKALMMVMTSLAVVIVAIFYNQVTISEGITSSSTYLTSDAYVKMTSQYTEHVNKPKKIGEFGNIETN